MNKKQFDKQLEEQRQRATDAQQANKQHAELSDGVYASAEGIVPQVGYATLPLVPILMHSVIAQQGMKELLATHAGLTDDISPVVFAVLAAAAVTLLVFMLSLAKEDVREERVALALKALAFLAACLFPVVFLGSIYNEAAINALSLGSSYTQTFLNNGPLIALGLIGFVGDSLVYFTAPYIQEALAGIAERWKGKRLERTARKEQRLLEKLEEQKALHEGKEDGIARRRKKGKDKEDDDDKGDIPGGDTSSEQPQKPSAEIITQRVNGNSSAYTKAVSDSRSRRK
jgi:cytochrome c biogenesis protein CcdA